jgi:hypothetical protein
MRALQVALYLHAALSLAFVLLAWRDGVAEEADLRFVVNTTAKDGLFAAVSVIAARDLARYGRLTLLLVGAYGLLIAGQAVELLLADPPAVESWPADGSPTTYLLSWMAADVVVAALLLGLYRRAR